MRKRRESKRERSRRLTDNRERMMAEAERKPTETAVTDQSYDLDD
jgi:hypothetical protein